MLDATQPPEPSLARDGVVLPAEESVRAGYETRDASTSLLVAVAVGLVLVVAWLLLVVWAVSQQVLPGPRGGGTSPPVVMPGDPSVNARIEAMPRPRIDSLEPLQAEPGSYRSSLPVPGQGSGEQHPEDLRANRQAALTGYAWLERGKVARIPISRAMDAVVESARTQAAPKGVGK